MRFLTPDKKLRRAKKLRQPLEGEPLDDLWRRQQRAVHVESSVLVPRVHLPQGAEHVACVHMLHDTAKLSMAGRRL